MSNVSNSGSTCTDPSVEPAVKELVHSRGHDSQHTVETLMANRMSLIAVFRAGFAALQFDVTRYTDDQIADALFGESTPSSVLTYRERLTSAFKRLRSVPQAGA